MTYSNGGVCSLPDFDAFWDDGVAEVHLPKTIALLDLVNDDGLSLLRLDAAHLGGELEPARAGALLAALRANGESAAEIRGFATAMRELALHPAIPDGKPTVDTVGTGGDGSGSLNLSTGTGLLAAACGSRVVKHGNRSVSSRSGSADMLECLGMPLPLHEPEAVACLEATNFTFLFAPAYHPAMKAVVPVRGAMGVRTVFNLLGPLTNPAAPHYLLLGAFSPTAARLMAEALARRVIGDNQFTHVIGRIDTPRLWKRWSDEVPAGAKSSTASTTPIDGMR